MCRCRALPSAAVREQIARLGGDFIALERPAGAIEDGSLFVLIPVGPLQRHVAELVLADFDTVVRRPQVPLRNIGRREEGRADRGSSPWRRKCIFSKEKTYTRGISRKSDTRKRLFSR